MDFQKSQGKNEDGLKSYIDNLLGLCKLFHDVSHLKINHIDYQYHAHYWVIQKYIQKSKKSKLRK